MNKDQKKLRRLQLNQQAQKRKLEKDKAIEADELLEDDDAIALTEEELPDAAESVDDETGTDEESEAELPSRKNKKSIRKDGMMVGVDMMQMGPTSFEELDAIEAAREQADEIREISWSVQDLVYNIVRNPMLDPAAKGEAIKNLGDEFSTRVSDILSGDAVEKDMDVLSIQAILAHDARHMGVTEKALDWISKKTLTAAARKKLTPEQFALPDKKAYPIHDKAHVRNALARAAQQIQAGGAAAADAKAALPKIRAAAKKMGIEASTAKEQNAIVVEKDAKGEWRWVGWSTNKFMDWDGEILAEAAHKEYTEWLDANPEMSPVFLSWHTPETMRKNAVDFWAYENGFLIMSGLLTEGEAAGLLRVQKEIDLGMSHGTIVLTRDPQNKKVITKYRMYEVSELPLENAANPFTSFDTVAKEAGMDKKAYFASLFGEDKAQKYLALTKETEEKLEDAGVQSKEKKETVSDQLSAVSEKQIDPVMLEQVLKAVGDKFGMEELNAYLAKANEALEKVPLLEELVKSFGENQDEALAEKISPKASGFIWMNKARASQSDGTKLKEGDAADEKLKKSAPTFNPETDWLAAQTGIAPIRQQ